MPDIARRRLLIALIAAAVGVAALGSAQPYGGGAGTTHIELRVWQGLEDPSDIALGARAPDGVWGDIGRVALPLDDGFSAGGHYRYGQMTLEVPMRDAAPVGVQVRVWQAARVPDLIYLSARGVGGSWDLVGTFRFLPDHGVSPDRRYRFGDVRIEVELPVHQVMTLAGSAMQFGYVDGVGAEARFGGNPVPGFMDLDIDSDGSVVVAAYYNQGIRRIAPDGTVTTIAGNNGRGLRDGPADVAQFHNPNSVAIAPDGSIYVSDNMNRRIRRVTPDGVVTTVAGSGPTRREDDSPTRRNGRALQAVFRWVGDIALAPDGDLFIIDGPIIRRLSPSGWVSTFAGGRYGFANGPADRAQFGLLNSVDTDAAGNVYVIDNNTHTSGEPGRVATIRKITRDGIVRTLYRDPFPAHDGGFLAQPSGIVVSDDGEIYIANTGRNQIVQLMPDGSLRAIAGTGEAGSLDGSYGAATFNFPGELALGPDGVLFAADQAASVVRAIRPGPDGFPGDVPLAEDPGLPRLEGVSVTVFAGHPGRLGYSGDGGPATAARFKTPQEIALDGSGGVLVADSRNHAVRRIAADGTVSTLAGGNGRGALDGAPEHAQFDFPGDIAIDGDGTVYVLDGGARRIRKIAHDGSVSTVEWDRPQRILALRTGADGNVLISSNREIWSLSPDGTMTLLGRDFNYVRDLVAADDGSLYFTDDTSTNFAVRRLTSAGDVETVFEDRRGIQGGLTGTHGNGLTVGADGSVYVADREFRYVFRITPDGAVAVVVDYRAVGSNYFELEDIIVTPEGDLLVSDWQHVIWKITIDEDAGR